MRAPVTILLALAAILLQDTSAAQACGDKFLLVGRGLRFQRAYAAIYPASIVVYAHPQRNATKAIGDPRLQANLKLAGHRVVLVENAEALARVLESDRVDLVLTDVADADRTSTQAAASPLKPAVLPVMYEPTGDEAKQIEARYQCRLKSSDRVDRYLGAIDDAMKVRMERKKKAF
jgi:CheY-like chemotaxis protein